MHVLTPTVIELLQQDLAETAADGSIDLSTSLARLAETEQYLAAEIAGSRYNVSYNYGLLFAQLAISLSGDDRDLILSRLVALLAQE